MGSFSSKTEIFFIKEDGKDFVLEKIDADKFRYQQGKAIFTPNAKGDIEHISFGLYSARKIVFP